MKEVYYTIFEYLIVYLIVYLLYFFLFVFKKTKYNKNKVPVEYYYLISIYNLQEKNINYKKFVYITSFINTFIITTTYIILTKLVSNFFLEILFGVIIIVLLIIICYGILGRIYQKRGKKNV